MGVAWKAWRRAESTVRRAAISRRSSADCAVYLSTRRCVTSGSERFRFTLTIYFFSTGRSTFSWVCPGGEREAVDSLTEADDHLVGGYLSAIDCSDRLDDGRGDLLTNFGRAARFREPSDVNERHDATVYARARPTPQGKGQLRVATDESRIYWLPSPKNIVTALRCSTCQCFYL